MSLLVRTARIATTVSLVLASIAGRSLAQCPVQTSKLIASDREVFDYFGNAVALSGSMAIVGSNADDDNGNSSGSAYVFDIANGLLTETFKLVPSDGAPFDNFGDSVAISGSIAVIGASGDDDNGGESGSAYLFDTTTGLSITKLLPDDPGAGDEFGFSVALLGTTVLVGAYLDDDNGVDSGSVYVFDTTTGLQIRKLNASDGKPDDQFGFSLALVGTTAIIGANKTDDSGLDSGAAYLFDVSTGLELGKILASDGNIDDRFGESVAITDSHFLVGARRDDDNGTNSGSAYVFDRATNLETVKLKPHDGATFHIFGKAVALNETMAVIGAFGQDELGFQSGAVYAFDLPTGQQVAKILSPDPSGSNDVVSQLGWAVAVQGNTTLVGSPGDDIDIGTAYIFELDECPDSFGSFCNGDGGDQMGCTDCPCMNNALPGTIGGCLNSAGIGSRLVVSGDTSVSLPPSSVDDLRFSMFAGPPFQLFIMNSGVALGPENPMNPCFGLDSGVSGSAFDGLRCAVSGTLRNGGRGADAFGQVGFSNAAWGGESNPPGGIAQFFGYSAGSTRYFQAIHRDNVAANCMTGLNTTQAIEVTFTP